MTDPIKQPKLAEALRAVLPKKPEYFDYLKLSPNQRREYERDAQEIAKSHVFNNEIQYLIKDVLYNTIMHGEDSHIDFARIYILALQDFKERIKSIQENDEEKPASDPTEAL